MHIKLKHTFQKLTYCLVKEYGQTSKAYFSLWFYLNFPSLQIVIAAMKLKDAYSLEGKLWLT